MGCGGDLESPMGRLFTPNAVLGKGLGTMPRLLGGTGRNHAHCTVAIVNHAPVILPTDTGGIVYSFTCWSLSG